MTSFTKHSRLKIKAHARHYYLGQALFYLRKGNEEEMHANSQCAEVMQSHYERIESEPDDL